MPKMWGTFFTKMGQEMEGAMINQASIESYREFSDEQLGDRQRKVYECIRENGPVTNRELSLITNLPINSVTPRVHELRSCRLVRSIGKRYDTATKRNVNEWVVFEYSQ